MNGHGKGIRKATLPLGAVVMRKHSGAYGRFVKVRLLERMGRHG